MTRVRILIHRTWAFCSTFSPITVADSDKGGGVRSSRPWDKAGRGGQSQKIYGIKIGGRRAFPWIRHCIIYILVSVQTVSSLSGVLFCMTGSPGRRPFSQNRRHRNSPSRRGPNNEKDLLKRRHVVHKRIVSSPVRRSRRLAGRRTPVGVGVSNDAHH